MGLFDFLEDRNLFGGKIKNLKLNHPDIRKTLRKRKDVDRNQIIYFSRTPLLGISSEKLEKKIDAGYSDIGIGITDQVIVKLSMMAFGRGLINSFSEEIEYINAYFRQNEVLVEKYTGNELEFNYFNYFSLLGLGKKIKMSNIEGWTEKRFTENTYIDKSFSNFLKDNNIIFTGRMNLHSFIRRPPEDYK